MNEYQEIKKIYSNQKRQVKKFLVYCYNLGYTKINILSLYDLINSYDFNINNDIEYYNNNINLLYNRIIQLYSKPCKTKNLLK